MSIYYGLSDPANDPDYNLHAPHNLSHLHRSRLHGRQPGGRRQALRGGGNGSATNNNGILEFDQLMRISYKDQGGVKTSDPTRNSIRFRFPGPASSITTIRFPSQVNVPEPAPLLLLAFGLVLLRRFGKSKAA